MTTYIKSRTGVNPERGEHEYGNVEFADSTNNKYPIDTPKHIRAAWSYIHHKDNAAEYRKGDVEVIKGRIKRAASKQGIELGAE